MRSEATTHFGEQERPETIAGRLRELEASEARYQTLFNNIPAAVLQVDASHIGQVFADLRKRGIEDIDGHLEQHPELVEFALRTVVVKEVNEVALTLFGTGERADLLSCVDYLFGETPQAAAKVMAARFKSQPNHRQKMKIRTFDGRMIDASLMVSYPQTSAALDRTVLMLVDVTEQTRLERELQRMEAEFAHVSKLSILAELSGAIVHEVRQPLSVVATDAATTLRWLSRTEPNLLKVRELVGRIEESAHRASEVVKRVNDLACRSGPDRDKCNLNRLVAEAIKFVRREGVRRGVQIVMDLSEDMKPFDGDAVQIQQLLVNLVMNAFQAIERSNKPMRRVLIRTLADGDKSVIEVSDTGGGIPEEISKNIFDSFFTTRQNGMGMGLSICRSIARRHNGGICGYNDNGGGAIFRVWFPGQRAGERQNRESGIPQMAAE